MPPGALNYAPITGADRRQNGDYILFLSGLQEPLYPVDEVQFRSLTVHHFPIAVYQITTNVVAQDDINLLCHSSVGSKSRQSGLDSLLGVQPG